MPANIDIIINGKDMTGGAVSSAKNGLASLGSSVDAVGGKMSAMTVAVGTVVGNLATAGIAKLGQFATSIVATGVNFDNMKQQADIAFTTMLGSGEKAKSFLDGLQAFAAKTPFEFPDLLMASQRMLAMGFQSDKVLPTLTAIGDAVAGLGGSSAMVDRVTTALGQMQAKGKATGEEMMQLTEAGIPAWEFLAKKIGVSIPDAMKMVTAGAVSADIAIGALTEGMNTKFGGMMEKQSATFGGLASTIKDTFAQVSGQVMQPFFELMTRGLQMIVTWTSSPSFTDGVAGLTRWFQLVSNAATVFFDNLMAGESVVFAMARAFATLLPPWVISAWTQIKVAVNEVFDVFAGRISVIDVFQRYWSAAWKAINQGVDLALDYLDQNLPVWQTKLIGWASAAWQWILDAIPVAVDKLKDWGAAIIGWLGKALPTFYRTFFEWGAAIYTWIGDAVPKAIDALSDFVRGLREKGEGEGGSQFTQMVGRWASTLWRWIRDDVIPEIGPALGDFLRSLVTSLQRVLVSVGTLAKELGLLLWQWVVDITPTAVQKLGEWGSALWGWIKQNAPIWKERVGEWASIAWQWLRDTAIPNAVEQLGKWGGALWSWIKANTSTWRENLGEWAAATWEWIRDIAIPKALEQLGIWAQMFTNWIGENSPTWIANLKQAGQDIIDALRDGIEIAWIRLTDWFFSDTAFGGFVGDILSMMGLQLGPAYGVMYENGKKITYSLNDGSRYGLDALRQTGSDMGSALSGGLKTNLDMHSPSRVMWGYGEDITGGLVGGVRKGLDGLRSEMQYVADTIKAAMDRANSDMLASIDYFTQQALVKAQAAQYKITNAAVDAAAILRQLNIDTSRVIGLGPNGELILPGITNLPRTTNRPVEPSDSTTATGDASEAPNYTSLSEALGIIENAAPAIAASTRLLGGLTLNQQDLDPEGTRNKGIIGQAVTSAFDSLKALLGGTDAITALSGQSGPVMESIARTLTSVGDAMQRIGETSSTIRDTESFRDTMNAFASRIVSTLWGGKQENALSGNSVIQEWLTSVTQKADQAIKDSLAAGMAALEADPLKDFITGMGDFLEGTLEGANQVFGYFKMEEENAFAAGALQEFMGSETAQTKTQLKGLFQGLQNSIADILGISTDELNVTGANSPRLLDRVSQLLSGTDADTNMESISRLLQSAVDFRNLSNYGTGATYFQDVLPTDTRLTGGAQTTNTFNITLAGSSNASADVMGMVQLLSSLTGTASP